ncbi:MAG: hypothetical protein OEO17_15700, partial [Gemmatimonadota bacterium]|nr:hypothetical protein [Gemmatimonadota bacterium]
TTTTTTTTATPTTTTTTTLPPLFDLDIVSLRASKQIRLSDRDRYQEVSIKLTVKNNSTVAGSATATLVGFQDGVPLVTFPPQAVSDEAGNGRSTYNFAYGLGESNVPGTIVWTVSFEDADDDVDEATAITVLR